MRTIEENRVTERRRVSAAMIDTAGWGAFLIWIGVALLADVGWGPGLLGAGVVALGVQATRKYFGMTVDTFGLMLGGCFAASGVWLMLELRPGSVALPLLPAVSIAVGVALLVSAWWRRPRE